MSHTPGDWRVVGPSSDGQHRRIFSGDEYLAIVGGSDQDMETIVANANLIAAAPDLLEIVERLATFVFLGEDELTELVKKSRAAMKKVRGE